MVLQHRLQEWKKYTHQLVFKNVTVKNFVCVKSILVGHVSECGITLKVLHIRLFGTKVYEELSGCD